MPPLVPPGTVSLASVTRMLPTMSRNFSTSAPTSSTSKPLADKSHHVLNLSASSFPHGYGVAATHCGVKKKAGVLDLGVLVSTSDRPCAAAACLTRNVFKAAPVTVTTDLLHSSGGRARGFVVNSGCANAVTGKKGLEDAWSMSKTVTSQLPPPPSSPSGSGESGTLVMSTGVIGQHLPIDKITGSLPGLCSSLSSKPEAWMDLARSFMTTDTFPKLRTREFALGGRTVRMAGIDKGAGMIAPNMGPPQPPHATLLGIIATDAAVSPPALQSALEYAVDRSFNSITVDGDMSTNDSIVCLANGAAASSTEGEASMEEIQEGSPEHNTFKEELRAFAEELAKLVVRDGEGATKFVTVRVTGAPSFDVANAVAKSVASSSLVKCAMYGEGEPSVLSSVVAEPEVGLTKQMPIGAGYSALSNSGYTALPENTISPSKVTVSFLPSSSISNQKPLRLLTNGEPEPNIDETRASEILAEEDLEVVVDLGDAAGEEARVWTCDFSHEYVTINGSVSYRIHLFLHHPES